MTLQHFENIIGCAFLLICILFCITFIAICIGRWIKRKEHSEPLFNDDCMTDNSYGENIPWGDVKP